MGFDGQTHQQIKTEQCVHHQNIQIIYVCYLSKLFAKIQLIIAAIWFCGHNWHKVAELIIPRRSETSLVGLVLGK